MKKLIIAILGLLILGGGGYGAYMYLNKPKLDEQVAEIPQTHNEKSSDIFVELEPVYVPIIDQQGLQKMVSLVVAIEVRNANEAERARSIRPKIINAILQDMYGVFSRENKRGSNYIKTSLIRKRLTKVSKKILGDKNVLGVKIQAVTQRRV